MRVEVRVGQFACKAFFRALRFAPEHVCLCLKQFGQVSGMNPTPSTLQVVPVPKKHVYECSCEPSIGRDEVCDVSAGEVRNAFSREFAFINREVGFQDEGLIIDGVVREG